MPACGSGSLRRPLKLKAPDQGCRDQSRIASRGLAIESRPPEVKGPIGPSDSLLAEFGKVPAAEQRGKPPALSAIERGVGVRRQGGPAARSPHELALSQATRGLAKQALIDLMIGDIANRSQVHAGFGLYHVLMGSPMVKKDLVQRLVFSEQDCSLILGDVPEATRAAIMRTLINRGRPVHWRGLRAFRVHFGFD